MQDSLQPRIDDRTNARNVGMARALGAFSLGLGAAQVVSPSSVARAIGVDDGERAGAVIRAVGVREIGVGLALLWSAEPAPFLWSRVAGDAMDVSMLAAAMASRDGDRDRRRRLGRALAAAAAITLPDVVASVRNGAADGDAPTRRDEGVVRASVTVRRSPDELYAFWHDLTRLPAFMTHVDSVTDAGRGRTHWRATAPAGTSIEWDAETTEDVPNSRISWRSVPGSPVETAGTIEFARAPADGGTEVRVRMSYGRPGGVAGRLVARLLGAEPTQQVMDDLRRFKQLMEAGEIVRSEASPEGTRTTRQISQRPGRATAS